MPTTTETTPFNGSWTYSLKISNKTGERTLAKRWHAFEFLYRDRIRSQRHTDNPGIQVVDLFQALPGEEPLDPPEDLNTSILKKPDFMRFLFSITKNGVAVVTSRMGYERSGDVRILPPNEHQHVEKPVDHIDMYDCSSFTNLNRLTSEHLSRSSRYVIDQSIEIDEGLVAETFRFMASCSSECD